LSEQLPRFNAQQQWCRRLSMTGLDRPRIGVSFSLERLQAV
jgi:hypothetical protein